MDFRKTSGADMIKNKLKAHWQNGQATLNGWLSTGSPFVAEILAQQGYDSLTVDIQHGVQDYSALLPILQAIRASGVVPLARVPWLEPGAIMKALDTGAYGVICPMVNTREQAETLVNYMRYPPDGTRSFGPTRVAFTAGDGYASEANAEVLCIAMIETAEAMRNLQDIVTTPGLDAIYIGPSDLTLGITDGKMGPGFDREEPEILDAIHTILNAAKAAGIRAMIHCGKPEYAVRAIGWGFDSVTLANDVRLLATGAGESVARVRALRDAQATDN